MHAEFSRIGVKLEQNQVYSNENSQAMMPFHGSERK